MCSSCLNEVRERNSDWSPEMVYVRNKVSSETRMTYELFKNWIVFDAWCDMSGAGTYWMPLCPSTRNAARFDTCIWSTCQNERNIQAETVLWVLSWFVLNNAHDVGIWLQNSKDLSIASLHSWLLQTAWTNFDTAWTFTVHGDAANAMQGWTIWTSLSSVMTEAQPCHVAFSNADWWCSWFFSPANCIIVSVHTEQDVEPCADSCTSDVLFPHLVRVCDSCSTHLWGLCRAAYVYVRWRLKGSNIFWYVHGRLVAVTVELQLLNVLDSFRHRMRVSLDLQIVYVLLVCLMCTPMNLASTLSHCIVSIKAHSIRVLFTCGGIHVREGVHGCEIVCCICTILIACISATGVSRNVPGSTHDAHDLRLKFNAHLTT